jgi:hypothetical protein
LSVSLRFSCAASTTVCQGFRSGNKKRIIRVALVLLKPEEQPFGRNKRMTGMETPGVCACDAHVALSCETVKLT